MLCFLVEQVKRKKSEKQEELAENAEARTAWRIQAAADASARREQIPVKSRRPGPMCNASRSGRRRFYMGQENLVSARTAAESNLLQSWNRPRSATAINTLEPPRSRCPVTRALRVNVS